MYGLKQITFLNKNNTGVYYKIKFNNFIYSKITFIMFIL